MYRNKYPYQYLVPMFPYPFWMDPQMYNMYLNNSMGNCQMYNPYSQIPSIELMDYGPNPFVANINDASIGNKTFRTALWTGDNLQVTLMNISVGDDIGLEVHETGDQFIRIEEGQGLVKMGNNKNNLDFQRRLCKDSAIIIPAGKWHNIINTGNTPLKLYAIYAPPEHPANTVHNTKEDAEAAERIYRYY